MKFIDITGDRYGRLTVLGVAGKTSNNHYKWECKCDCGKLTVVTGANLKNGHTTSCGCFAGEKTRAAKTKHNMSKSRIYKEWYRMLMRCRCTKWVEADRYVGRGITVCEEWKNSFETFRDWAFANGYDDSLSIDRIDNDKGYSPENCRWADFKTQCRNRSTNVLIEYNGETKTLVEWSEILGIKYGTLHSRIYKLGLDPKEAFERPLRVQ